jgi:hypothetical protein
MKFHRLVTRTIKQVAHEGGSKPDDDAGAKTAACHHRDYVPAVGNRDDAVLLITHCPFNPIMHNTYLTAKH